MKEKKMTFWIKNVARIVEFWYRQLKCSFGDKKKVLNMLYDTCFCHTYCTLR
jgi:hypothetical protein